MRVLRSAYGDPRAAAELAARLTERQRAGLDPLPAEPADLAPGVLGAHRRAVRALPDDTRLLLLLAAADQYPVATHAFLRAVAAARLDTRPLEAAETAGIACATAGGVGFRDAWTRIAAYETAAPADRRDVHRLLARVLHGAGETARRSWHRGAGALGPSARLAAELAASADRARAAGDPALSAALAERAAALCPDPRERHRLLTDAATDAWNTGAGDRARSLAAQLHTEALHGVLALRTGQAAEAFDALTTGAAAAPVGYAYGSSDDPVRAGYASGSSGDPVPVGYAHGSSGDLVPEGHAHGSSGLPGGTAADPASAPRLAPRPTPARSGPTATLCPLPPVADPPPLTSAGSYPPVADPSPSAAPARPYPPLSRTPAGPYPPVADPSPSAAPARPYPPLSRTPVGPYPPVADPPPPLTPAGPYPPVADPPPSPAPVRSYPPSVPARPGAASVLTASHLLARAAEAAVYTGDLRRCREALVAARRLGIEPPGVLGGLAAAVDGRYEDARDLLEATAGRCGPGGDPTLLVHAGIAALLLGDHTRAATATVRAAAAARARGLVSLVSQAQEFRAYADFWTGRPRAAEAAALDALGQAYATGQDNGACHLQAALAMFAALTGDADLCRERAAAARAHALSHGLGLPAALAQWALAHLDLAHGRYDAAAVRLRALAGLGPGHGHRAIRHLATPHYVEAAVRSGDTRVARAAHTDYDRWARAVRSPDDLALSARCRALLAPGADAVEHYREALDLHDHGTRAVERARTELLFGGALRRLRRRTEARDRLHSALEAFESFGAPHCADRARVELRALGAPAATPRVPESPTQLLTAQQLRVARMAAEGATNREIAARLALSPRTIDHHLRGVFTRLGIRSRIELVRLLTEEPAHIR
ncbi:LuxR C-terminal-related transcriptional regulator [Streptomyces sp. A012304]|uniref:helix-turn-helix transcriptional regulator n=1 Tax=Streptomyces sp. A012304 TaxID=375446 RepID=UPI002802AB92|nr:hypothetical protein ALMP_82860 [Streptomyces sp. A012304]